MALPATRSRQGGAYRIPGRAGQSSLGLRKGRVSGKAEPPLGYLHGCWIFETRVRTRGSADARSGHARWYSLPFKRLKGPF